MATTNSRTPGKPPVKDEQKNRLAEIEREKMADVGFSNENAIPLEDAPVVTASGMPDMRFKENRKAFLYDRLKKINGSPDNRLKTNRPDIQQVHAGRGDDRPNCRFAGPGVLREASGE